MLTVREVKHGGCYEGKGEALCPPTRRLPIITTWWVERDGQRIDSFLLKSRALRCARDLQRPDEPILVQPSTLRAYKAVRGEGWQQEYEV